MLYCSSDRHWWWHNTGYQADRVYQLGDETQSGFGVSRVDPDPELRWVGAGIIQWGRGNGWPCPPAAGDDADAVGHTYDALAMESMHQRKDAWPPETLPRADLRLGIAIQLIAGEQRPRSRRNL